MDGRIYERTVGLRVSEGEGRVRIGGGPTATSWASRVGQADAGRGLFQVGCCGDRMVVLGIGWCRVVV